MIPRAWAEEALRAALATGGDFADLFVEDTDRTSLERVGGQVKNATVGRDAGAGVRIVKGENYVYATTCDLSRQGLVEAARKAAAALSGSAGKRDVLLCESVPANIHPVKLLSRDIPFQKKIEVLRAAEAAALGVSGEIAQVWCSIADVDQRVLIANSEGLYVQDRRVRTRLVIRATATFNGENQDAFHGPGALKGWEYILSLDPAAIGKKVGETAVRMAHADPAPAGVMPVIIGPGEGGVIFHEACGHSLEATGVARGDSELAGKMGQVIASPLVSAVDDGTLAGEWGSLNIDDEGHPTQRNALITNGVLTSYMVDRVGGIRMKCAATGSSRRQNYTFAPTSRMTNTFICPGKDTEEAIIASTGEGIYTADMSGGSVNPTTGEFNFAVSEAYLIKNGKIDRPVRGATLVGRGSEVLMNIDRVADNLAQNQGMCGSMSGAVPTNVGQPTIRVKSMTVGGR